MTPSRERLASWKWTLGALALTTAAVYLLLGRSRINDWTITNPHPQGAHIVAFGDSLTAGFHTGPGESYPEQLSRLLGKPILNRGVSGDTTADALLRLEKDVLAENPRIVLLCLGGNDMLRRLPADAQFANLRQAIQRIQAKGALVVLLGTEGFRLDQQDYDRRFRELARETGSVYVPNLMKGILSERSLMYDQIHPNAAGNARIARRLENDVGSYLRR